MAPCIRCLCTRLFGGGGSWALGGVVRRPRQDTHTPTWCQLLPLPFAGLDQNTLLYFNTVLALPLMAGFMLLATNEAAEVARYPQASLAPSHADMLCWLPSCRAVVLPRLLLGL